MLNVKYKSLSLSQDKVKDLRRAKVYAYQNIKVVSIFLYVYEFDIDENDKSTFS